jgi:hypothetical protein
MTFSTFWTSRSATCQAIDITCTPCIAENGIPQDCTGLKF